MNIKHPDRNRRWHRQAIVCLFLVLLTSVVYLRVSGYEFVNYDDDLYVTANAQVQKGLTLKNMLWAFSTMDIGNWHPLTWISHQLDVQLWGMDSGRHHFTSVLFHIANGLILFLALNRMTGGLRRSAAVAALFALHPISVESVAWVAERKNVLSTFFWMLTMWSYSRYAENPARGKYLQVLFFFMLGLMTKPMLVTLPFVLLLLDYWPLKRFQVAADRNRSISSLIREKIPLFVLAIGSCWVSLLAQQGSGAVWSLEAIPLALRAANALVGYAAYMGKAVLPFKLAVFYPYPAAIPGWKIAAAGSILALFSGLAWKVRMRHPYVLVGWLWYLGTLVPVIGFVQLGAQAMADRYAYVPLIGLFIAIVWSVEGFFKIKTAGKKWIPSAAVLILGFLAMTTWVQVGYWKNSIELYRHAIEVTRDNYLAHNNFGNALAAAGKNDEAYDHYVEALEINPDYADALYNAGTLLAARGRLDEAIDHYRAAIKSNPALEEAYYNLGTIWGQKGQYAEALRYFSAALQLDPNYAEAYNNIGVVLIRQGRINEAAAHFQKAVELKADYAAAQKNLQKARNDMQRMDSKEIDRPE